MVFTDGTFATGGNIVTMPPPTHSARPVCPHCGERVGAYEPVWHLTPPFGAERTSWLDARQRMAETDTLWHVACAEVDGFAGG